MNNEYKLAISALQQGRIIAYPTEAVFGLGCDPANEQAVLSLLKIKQRSLSKGLILVAGDFKLLAPFVDINAISDETWNKINTTWPGPVTWVLPKSEKCPGWISGQFNSVAVRVSEHPVIKDLANEFGGALVSTSANPSGVAPAINAQQVSMMFGNALGMIIDAPLGASNKPSEIFDGITGQQFR